MRTRQQIDLYQASRADCCDDGHNVHRRRLNRGQNAQYVWRLPTQKWDKDMIEPVSTARQPGRMVWGAIWMSPSGVVGRSPLVIMTRDISRRRQGYTTTSYLTALEEGLLPYY